jgi:malonyl-CoA O-methyltransferase
LNSEYQINKGQVAAAFNRAASHYEEVAVLQRTVGERLLERLDLVKLTPTVVLDVGAGTGVQTAELLRRYSEAQILALDLAPAMLAHAQQRLADSPKQGLAQHLTSIWHRFRGRRCAFVCGDAERLPVAEQSVDLLFSNLTLQWCSALDRVLAEFRRVLKPGGLLTFTTLGPDTLKELRTAWSGVDSSRHVNPFLDMHDIGDALLRTGLTEPVMDVEHYTLTYPDVPALLCDLKRLGAHTVGSGRPQGLMGKERQQKMMQGYEEFRRDGRLPASFEVIYGHAWGVAQARQRRTSEGAVHIPLHSLKRPSKHNP